MAPFGQVHIRSILGQFPPTRLRLCENQQQNVLDYEDTIRNMHSKGVLSDDDVVVVVVPVDRAVGTVYDQQITINKLLILTTKTSCQMVLSVGDVVNDVPDEDREFVRHVRNTEKLVAQGFPKTTHLHLSSALAQKAAGNAYPVQLIQAVLAPLLQKLEVFDFAAWPAAAYLASHADAMQSVVAASKLFEQKPRKLKLGRSAKAKGQESTSLARRKKRKKRAGSQS